MLTQKMSMARCKRVNQRCCATDSWVNASLSILEVNETVWTSLVWKSISNCYMHTWPSARPSIIMRLWLTGCISCWSTTPWGREMSTAAWHASWLPLLRTEKLICVVCVRPAMTLLSWLSLWMIEETKVSSRKQAIKCSFYILVSWSPQKGDFTVSYQGFFCKQIGY